MPAGLSADQKAKNREIVKRMQMKAWVFKFWIGRRDSGLDLNPWSFDDFLLGAGQVNFLKNPRFLADRGGKDKGEPCPFWLLISISSLFFWAVSLLD